MAPIYIMFPEGRSKALTFSYDDGVVQDKRLIEIFNKFGLKATFNLCSNIFYDRRAGEVTDWWKPMTLDEAKKLYIGSGHEIALHSHNHPYPHHMTREAMTWETVKNREVLEREFGCIVKGMAYPQGTYNDETIEALKSAGVAYSRTVKNTHSFSFPPENWLTLHPTCHHNDKDIFELAEKFVSLEWGTCMFYIWGHSYEFDQQNNWDHMEKLCEKLSGNNNIWYATNIEIYNYKKAFDRLEMSLEGDIIHNPTSTDLWIKRNSNLFESEIFKIPAGETVKL